MSAYSEKFKDPRWQKKRLEILERDEFTCQLCGDKESTLHVHHWYYEKGKDPWEYPDMALITLCEDCHKERHANNKAREDAETYLIQMLRVAKFDYTDLDMIANGLAEFNSNKTDYSISQIACYIKTLLDYPDKGCQLLNVLYDIDLLICEGIHNGSSSQ
jgi:hypothetical protein